MAHRNAKGLLQSHFDHTPLDIATNGKFYSLSRIERLADAGKELRDLNRDVGKVTGQSNLEVAISCLCVGTFDWPHA